MLQRAVVHTPFELWRLLTWDRGNRGVDFHLEWEFGSVFFEMKTLKSLLVMEGGL